jgi:predicted nucleic acid-binding protein
MNEKKGPFVSSHPRKFYLSEVTIQRLGGPPADKIMELLLEGLPDLEIIEQLGISAADFNTIVLCHPFKRELTAQRKLRDQDKKFRTYGRINSVPPHQLAGKARPTAKNTLPAEVAGFQLPKGVSPQEWALKRINQVTPQAVERLIHLMHNARQEQVQYNAATKLLGLNGIVEVEKSISIIADAEAIIRELNKRGPYKPKTVEGEALEAAELVTVLTKEECQVSGDSETAPQTLPEGSEAS